MLNVRSQRRLQQLLKGLGGAVVSLTCRWHSRWHSSEVSGAASSFFPYSEQHYQCKPTRCCCAKSLLRMRTALCMHPAISTSMHNPQWDHDTWTIPNGTMTP